MVVVGLLRLIWFGLHSTNGFLAYVMQSIGNKWLQKTAVAEKKTFGQISPVNLEAQGTAVHPRLYLFLFIERRSRCIHQD